MLKAEVNAGFSDLGSGTSISASPACTFRAFQLALAGAVLLLVSTALAQLALGADPLVLALSVCSIAIGFYPILFVGLDLYTVFAALFCFRYTGGVLVAKTLYGQPLDSLLRAPLESYALTTVLIGTVTAVTMLARRWDRGTTIFPLLPTARHARQIGLVAYCLGAGAAALSSQLAHVDGDAANAGAAFVISSAVMTLMFLGYAAETLDAVRRTGGRQLFSPRLVGMLGVAVVLALVLNIRSLAVNSVLCVFLCGIMLRAIRARHVLVGALMGLAFATYVSPVALELRTLREGKSAAQLASDVVELVARTATETGLIDELQRKEAYRSQFQSGTLQYDYFGDASNILNRLAFVALLDTVYAQTRVLNPIGLRAITTEVIPRIVPGFLVDKEVKNYGYGDWLSWEIGLIETGRVAYLSFSLPVEGVAVFGPLIGVTLWPLLFMLPILLILGRISSFRVASATSLFLLSAYHWDLIEAPSNGYIGMITRGFPISVLMVWCLTWVWANLGQFGAPYGPAASPSRGRPVRRSAPV